MKRSYTFAVCLFLCFSTVIYSNTQTPIKWQGFYLGALIGLSWVDYSHFSFTPAAAPTQIIDKGLAPSFQFGYGFNSYFALETGVIYIRKPIFKHLHHGSDNGRFKNNVVYLVAKLSLLIKKSYRIFTKLGVGYVVRDSIIDNGAVIINGSMITRPIYALGVDYRVAQHWELELMWMQAAKLSSKQLPASNYIGVGAHYLFL